MLNNHPPIISIGKYRGKIEARTPGQGKNPRDVLIDLKRDTDMEMALKAYQWLAEHEVDLNNINGRPDLEVALKVYQWLLKQELDLSNIQNILEKLTSRN